MEEMDKRRGKKRDKKQRHRGRVGGCRLLCPCNQVARGSGPARVKGVMGKKQP